MITISPNETTCDAKSMYVEKHVPFALCLSLADQCKSGRMHQHALCINMGANWACVRDGEPEPVRKTCIGKTTKTNTLHHTCNFTTSHTRQTPTIPFCPALPGPLARCKKSLAHPQRSMRNVFYPREGREVVIIK